MNIKLRNVLLGSFILLAGMASIGVNVVDNNYISTTFTAKAAEEGEVFTINLNNVDATTVGSTTIYEKYGVNYYSDAECTTLISSIDLPIKTNSTGLNAVFGGYYAKQGGQGDQIIDAEGNIVASVTNFSEDVTLYAKWTVAFTFDCNVSQGGTGGQFTKDAVLNGGIFTVPTKGDLKKVGYKLNEYNAWNANQDGSSKTIYLWMPGSISGSEVKSLYEKGANVFYANWTSKEEDIAIGAGNFNKDIAAVCDESGTSTDFSALKTKWDWWAFQINEDDLYWMREDRSSDTRILTMLEKYDYILGKYGYGEGEGQLKDFLNRKPVVKQVSNNVMMLFNLNDDSNYTLSITLISSTVALLVTTGLSLLVIKNHKTRKQD